MNLDADEINLHGSNSTSSQRELFTFAEVAGELSEFLSFMLRHLIERGKVMTPDDARFYLNNVQRTILNCENIDLTFLTAPVSFPDCESLFQ